MASARYTRNITLNENPKEPASSMTPRQKWENFWFYYKWPVLGGLLALALATLFIKDLLFQTKPDYTFALLTQHSIPTGVCESLQQGLTSLCDDRNGDNTVSVLVLSYVIPEDADNVAPNVQMANIAKLAGDLQTGRTMLFLTDEPVHFADTLAFFAYNDGTALPEGDGADPSRLGVRWGDCPVLASLALSDVIQVDGSTSGTVQSYLEEYYLVRRAYTGTRIEDDKNIAPYYEDNIRLFETWTGH